MEFSETDKYVLFGKYNLDKAFNIKYKQWQKYTYKDAKSQNENLTVYLPMGHSFQQGFWKNKFMKYIRKSMVWNDNWM